MAPERTRFIQEIREKLVFQQSQFRLIVLERTRKLRVLCQTDGVLDSAETSSRGFESDMEMDLTRLKSEELDKINDAIRAIDNGTYGNCEECGDEISQARLEALNFAVRCISCELEKTAAEKAKAYSDRSFESLERRGVGGRFSK
jgi:DnaK suppressor protein